MGYSDGRCQQIGFLIFFAIIFVLLIGGTGANFLMKREVTCLSYLSGTSDSVNIIDHANLTFVGSLEDAVERLSLPRTCWVDINEQTTFTNPTTVLKWSIISFFIVYGTFLLITICICLVRGRKDTRDDYFGTYSYSSDEYYDLSILYIIVIFIAFVISLIVFGVYQTQATRVNCTGMTKCSPDSLYYECFNYYDSGNAISGTAELDPGSFLPSDFPATCWLKGGNVTFYDPKWLGIWFTVIFFSLLGINILYIIIFKLMKYCLKCCEECDLERQKRQDKRREEERIANLHREKEKEIELDNLKNSQIQITGNDDKKDNGVKFVVESV